MVFRNLVCLSGWMETESHEDVRFQQELAKKADALKIGQPQRSSDAICGVIFGIGTSEDQVTWATPPDSCAQAAAAW